MKKGESSWGGFFTVLGCLPFAFCLFNLGSWLLNANKIYQEVVSGNVKLLCFIFGSILYVVLYFFLVRYNSLSDKYKTAILQNQNETEKLKKDLEQKYNDKEKTLSSSILKKELDIYNREKIVQGFVESLDKEKYCAELIADFKTVIYEEARKNLLQRPHVASVAAETVKKLKSETKQYIVELKEYKYKEKERIDKIENEAKKRIEKAEKAEHFIKSEMESKSPFMEVAELYGDIIAIAYGEIAQQLREKVRPANRTANEIESVLKEKIREVTSEEKKLRYRLNFLLSVFPELKQYIDDDSALLSISEYRNIGDFSNNIDKVRDWVDQNEYERMSVDQRNQLALDRYKNRRKNNWEIGIDYELYVGYLLRNGMHPFEGKFYVQQFGELNGLEDLGRDIIAERANLDGSRDIYIIQCKRWTERSFVHENAICQLYGTTIEYQIKHRNYFNCKFTPVFVTTTDLSDMAKEFAKRLGVVVMKIPIGDYPMIKCNINNNEKIYHLPFDQQYHNTVIKKDGEFYAWTVQEATRKGFRRAMRHYL